MNKIIDALKLAEEAMTSNMRLLSAKALAAIREALEEQEKQEPVAEVRVRPLRGNESAPQVDVKWVTKPTPGFLYAAPVSAKREWVNPTPQDVYGLVREGAAGGGWQGFASRLSAWLKEKNNG